LAPHAADRHGHPAAALAFSRGFHEGEHLKRLFGRDRRLADLEELADFDAERLIAGVLADGRDALGAEDEPAVAGRSVADAAEGADAAVLPGAGRHVGVLGVRPRHAL